MRIHSLGIFLTQRCNFRCPYCCIQTGEDPPDKLSLEELQDVTLQAKALGARWLIIAGEGEPLLDENLFPLIEFASSSRLAVKVYTNGSLIDDAIAARLYRLGTFIVLKLHALDPAVFDSLAGCCSAVEWDYLPESYGIPGIRVPVGFRRLTAAGYCNRSGIGALETRLQIESVVVRQNLDAIPEIARLCRKLHIDYHIETMIRTHMNSGKLEEWKVTPDEEAELFRKLCRILGLKFRLQQKIRCRFETNPLIDVSGNIRRCFALGANIGNIRDTSLSDLHRTELMDRRSRGFLGPKFSMTHCGFRYCSSRKALDDRETSG